MGTAHEYCCPDCGYSAIVSGGRDIGMVVVVRTMTCISCKELVDVIVGFYGEDGPVGDAEMDKDLHVCPECGGDEVTAWGPDQPCPRCDSAMNRNEGYEELWD